MLREPNWPSALDDVNPLWLASLLAVLAGGVWLVDYLIKESVIFD